LAESYKKICIVFFVVVVSYGNHVRFLAESDKNILSNSCLLIETMNDLPGFQA